MNIYLPNVSEQQIGGGWTFLRNLKEALSRVGSVSFTGDWSDADIILISGVTLADRAQMEEAKKKGKVIVFRVDNIPKKSRNKRSRVYDNMKRFAELADMVVYQSEWAREYAGWICGDVPSLVIYNGVDTKIFRVEEGASYKEKNLKYLYVHFNRDENKRFPEAAYHFHMRFRQDPKVSLTLVGQFSPDLVDAGFDFFAGENVEFVGPVADPKVMAEIYRDHDVLLFPAFADAAPNTVLEARACGLTVELVNEIGGTRELLDPDLDISLERMGKEYYGLFQLLLSNTEVSL